jgi:hypothetical protein
MKINGLVKETLEKQLASAKEIHRFSSIARLLPRI